MVNCWMISCHQTVSTSVQQASYSTTAFLHCVWFILVPIWPLPIGRITLLRNFIRLEPRCNEFPSKNLVIKNEFEFQFLRRHCISESSSPYSITKSWCKEFNQFHSVLFYFSHSSVFAITAPESTAQRPWLLLQPGRYGRCLWPVRCAPAFNITIPYNTCHAVVRNSGTKSFLSSKRIFSILHLPVRILHSEAGGELDLFSDVELADKAVRPSTVLDEEIGVLANTSLYSTPESDQRKKKKKSWSVLWIQTCFSSLNSSKI